MNRLYIIAASCCGLGTILAFWYPAVGLVFTNICFVLVVRACYLMELRQAQDFEKNNEALKEAGNAITETLRVAFSNLKKTTMSLTKQASVTSDHTRRIHRLEQLTQKSEHKLRRPNSSEQPNKTLGKKTPELNQIEDEN